MMKRNFLSLVSMVFIAAMTLTSCEEMMSAIDNPVGSYVQFPSTELTLQIGEDRPFQATTISPAKITYKSSDESVVTIDPQGFVTGIAFGEATITASVPATEYYAAGEATCKVKVVNVNLPKATATAPTAKTGVKAGENAAIINAGVTSDGTMMYAVTTTNTKPTSTTDFSATIPTAQSLAAGTCYVWYYVKADATHADSDIDGSVSVTIAEAVTTTTVTWNKSDITGSGTSFTKDGVTLTAFFMDLANKVFMGPGTFTTSLGKFTKIEVTAKNGVTGTGWSGNTQKKTWTGTASNSVSFDGLLDGMSGDLTIVFTIEPNS